MYEAGIILFHSSLVAYVVSLWHFGMYVFRGAQRLASRGLFFSLVGLAIHGIAIVTVSVGQARPPWANSLQNISFWCWVVVAISVAVSYRFRLKVLGLFVMPLVLVLLFMAMVGQKSSSAYGEEVGRTFWAAVHVGLVFVAYASFAFAAVLGFIYILHSRFLKKKETGELSDKLPSLDLLDRLNYRALLAGLGFLTAGLLLGLLWLAALPKKPEGLDPKVTGSAVIWMAYAVLSAMRATGVLRGRKVAWLSVLGIAVIVLSFLFVPHLLPKGIEAAHRRKSAQVRVSAAGVLAGPATNMSTKESVGRRPWT